MSITVLTCVFSDDGTGTIAVRLSSGEHEETRSLCIFTEELPESLCKVPREITAEQFSLLEESAERCSAYCSALRILSYGDNTTASLRMKLRRKRYSSEAVAFAVARASEMGYLDDDAFLREAVLHAANDKLYGSRRIEAEMRAKGFTPEQIRRALSVCADEIDIQKNKRQLILRKFGHLSPENREEALKIKAFLYRYGY